MRDQTAPWWGMMMLPKSLSFSGAWRSPVSRRAVLAAMFAGCLLMAGCGKQWSWHEKIIVEVDTPHGMVSSSSVIRRSLTYQNSSLLPPEARGASSNLSGEAVALEIAPGRYLFVLLKGLPNSFKIFFPGEAPVAVADRFETLREARELSPDQYPLLVTFTDINDPTTVRKVDPDNLAATFGPGVSLKRVTLEITHEKVTEGKVESLLTWLDWPKVDPAINGGRTETLRYPNESPRGYGTLPTLSFVQR
jgi:hypothetical protein